MSLLTKILEDAAIAVGGAATVAFVDAARKHGPTIAKKAKNNAPVAFEAAKDKASDAVDTAKVVGQAAKRKFKK